MQQKLDEIMFSWKLLLLKYTKYTLQLFFCQGETLLQSRDQYEASSLQLYSLTERLKLPEPTCDSGDVKKDLGHILDFITRARHLKVVYNISLSLNFASGRLHIY